MANQIKIDQTYVNTFIELSSETFGGRVLSVSDEFFAEAFHLLKSEPAQSLKGEFGPKGALYSGWESRRHNPDHDWCVIQLGVAGSIVAFDIDTSHFNGNEAPVVSVEALEAPGENVTNSDPRWTAVLEKVNLGPNSQHLFPCEPTKATANFTHVKLNMYPDGGIARFRVYGVVKPIHPSDRFELFDLALFSSGGRVVGVSDQHFGRGGNLILPGRGKDMGDGWETKRSRQPGHKDWAIIKLGCTGYLDNVEIDTNHFMGNYPESVELHALNSDDVNPGHDIDSWEPVLPRTKMGPHRQHFLHLDNCAGKPFSHVRVTVYPDGGIKRVRVNGRVTNQISNGTPRSVVERNESKSDAADSQIPEKSTSDTSAVAVQALPLTVEAFTGFGSVVQAYTDVNAAPKSIKVVAANQGTATKFIHTASLIHSSFPDEVGSLPRAGFSVYRAAPHPDARLGELFHIKVLERHPYNNQAFFLMGNGRGGKLWDNDLDQAGRAYLVVVARNGADDRPDMGTVRAFVASASQGVVYDAGIWHHPILALEETMDFACIETQVGGGSKLDCEIVTLDAPYTAVFIPKF